jgi:hypothetical protein
MNYPYCALNRALEIYPLLGEQFSGNPHAFDLSSANPLLLKLDVADQRAYQSIVDQELSASGRSWGIAGYLEKRDTLLRNLPQMVSEGRFYHLGVDIFAPAGTSLFAPIHATVEESGYEGGKGQYGGYTILRCRLSGCTFYLLFGHLEKTGLPARGKALQSGQTFARIGDFNENGDWFHHTHMQVITERGSIAGYFSKGYCAESLLASIGELCPSPLYLLRYA